MTKLAFCIDRGGTFTDLYVKKLDGSSRVLKLLSEDHNYTDAPTEGIRQILESELNQTLPRNEPIDASCIEWIRMGTTVATNALLERKGERCALVVTKGFKDLLYIGNQTRPKLFDLAIEHPKVLYDEILEIDERVVPKNENDELSAKHETDLAKNGETVEIWQKINVQDVEEKLKILRKKGIKSLAVLFLHSYKYPNHELIVEDIAKRIGFENISLSSQIMPMIKAVPRGFTSMADAYLTPVIQRYITSFMAGFKNLDPKKLLFMQSDGGLSPVHSFCGSRAILSGPAGGVVGVALTVFKKFEGQWRQPVIGYDMGGTSTDVSRFDGQFDHVFDTTTAGITIQAPQLNIQTVAAGGGSRLFFQDGLFVVGPDSVGATPGPVCYKKGGKLAVTDANLILGRINPEFFPKLFGAGENEPLDVEKTKIEFEKMLHEINEFSMKNQNRSMTMEEAALGFIQVANESMCRPIRALTQGKGYDTSKHVLACFGGAGGQHACSIAKLMGIKCVFVHKHASVLSAFGLSLADVVHEMQEPSGLPCLYQNFSNFKRRLLDLASQCQQKLINDGFPEDSIKFKFFLHMRYSKTDCAIMCESKPGLLNSVDIRIFSDVFLENYQREFGFTIPQRVILVDDIRVRAVANLLSNYESINAKVCNQKPHKLKSVKCYFEEGYLVTDVFEMSKLINGQKIQGPALIIEPNSTIVIEPDCCAEITATNDVKIEIGTLKNKADPESDHVDPIQLSIFSHRFMSIAEQMGRILQRSAISTNIKERLDFSCALFSEDGGLVANAPHIPVHLGSMQETVKFQMQLHKNDMKHGDVILSNDPNAGGSHLPDFTVVTPVFYNNSTNPLFYVANRGHHADIGGIVPGSMPPHSTRLVEEGAVITSMKVVQNGQFDEDAVVKILQSPSNIPGCSAARNIPENLSDLRAQIAANQKGIALMVELIDCYGLATVQKYMMHIQENADLTVRKMLKMYGQKAIKENGIPELRFSDFMDDGTEIKLKISIDIEKGEAIFDFTGTGHEVYNSTNAPKAVTQAAIIYCLRCLVGRDIPLNQGCLKPISIIFPPNSIINPSPDAAVVGGNVVTSQRLVDVILGACGASSASQGCMNNITFGDESCGYYETVGGGSGATFGNSGRSGVHTHMTNTRITDPEILEQRYPVVLKKFHLRDNSGGKGKWCGGDGIIRQYLFRKHLTLSILTERRVFSPYGLEGGDSGEKGSNLLTFASGRTVYLGSKATVNVSPGDIFTLKTPGGGGYGTIKDCE